MYNGKFVNYTEHVTQNGQLMRDKKRQSVVYSKKYLVKFKKGQIGRYERQNETKRHLLKMYLIKL